MFALPLMTTWATEAVYDGLTLARKAYETMRSLDPEESKMYIAEIDIMLKYLEPHATLDKDLT